VDASLGASGSKVIRVNASSAPSPNFVVVSAAQFDGVRQATPLVTNSAARSYRVAENANITGTITLPISGSVMYSMASGYYAGGPVNPVGSLTSLTGTAGLLPMDEGQIIATVGYRGTGSPLAAGDFTMVGWDYGWHQTGFQFLVALVPAQAP
jgi:hypothetical protein